MRETEESRNDSWGEEQRKDDSQWKEKLNQATDWFYLQAFLENQTLEICV